MFYGTDNILWNILHIKYECDEYSTGNCHSRRSLSRLWIMLWQNIEERESLHTSLPLIIEHENHEVVCSSEVTFWSWFGSKIWFRDQELVYSMSFQMNREQIYRGSMVNVGWVQGKFVHMIITSPKTCGLVFSHEQRGEKNLLKATPWLWFKFSQYSMVLLINLPPK